MPTSPHPDPLSWAEGEPTADPASESAAPPASADGFFDQELPDPVRPDDVYVSIDAAAPESSGHEGFTDRYDRDSNDAVADEQHFRGTEYAASPGLPARGVIVVSSAAALGCAALDFALTGGLSMFFDLCFVVISLVGAMAVRRRDLFTTGVLAPLVFGGVIGVVAFIAPHAFVNAGGFSKVFMTGLAEHAGALVAGYGVALATVAGRVSATRPAP